jgi:hypothetical protein
MGNLDDKHYSVTEMSPQSGGDVSWSPPLDDRSIGTPEIGSFESDGKGAVLFRS